jgi:hypothetical protein
MLIKFSDLFSCIWILGEREHKCIEHAGIVFGDSVFNDSR